LVAGRAKQGDIATPEIGETVPESDSKDTRRIQGNQVAVQPGPTLTQPIEKADLVGGFLKVGVPHGR